MSDLTTKFEGLESQLATQHTEIGAALDDILAALGSAPASGATLADVITAIGTTNANLITMSSQLGSINSQLIGANSRLNGIRAEQLTGNADINTNLDIIINNNSLNAQKMIAAIYATFCACDVDIPVLPAPIDVTPTEIVDDALCRRIQFYLSVFTTWLQSIASYGSTGAALTGDVIQNLLQIAGAAAGMTATGAEIGASVGIPGVVLGAVVGAIAGAIFAFGGNVLIGYSNTFSSPLVQEQLIAALYGASNAEQGQAAFQSVIGANFDVIPAAILNFLWYSAWSNDLYSGSPVVDDSAFDGTICANGSEVGDCIVQNVPGDEGTTNYEWEGNTYSRAITDQMSFTTRITDATTFQPSVRVYCSFGAIGAFVEADEVITWSDINARIGGAYPHYIDSALPTAGYTIEWCNLAPL